MNDPVAAFGGSGGIGDDMIVISSPVMQGGKGVPGCVANGSLSGLHCSNC